MTKRHEEPGIEALQVGPTVSGYLGDPSRFRVSVARTWIPLPLLPTPPPARAMQPATANVLWRVCRPQI